MRVAEIKYNDIANGPGVRTSLFVSGCTHHCKNCFNQIAWDFDYGKLYNQEIENQIIDSLKPDYMTGLTLLGGEPMEPVNQVGLLPLLKRVKKAFPNRTIWCFTGYNFEDILPGGKIHLPISDELLSYIDVLVDGEFKEEQKDISLIFKGSANQRTIDIPKSLKENKIILVDLKKGSL